MSGPYAYAAADYWNAGWRGVPNATDAHRDRFLAKVTPGDPDECRLWTASPSSLYGSLNVAGRPLGAHVISWAVTNGRWPEPHEVVRHSCDTPKCVNPHHLLIGAPADNTADMVARGRAKWNEATWFPRTETCPAGHDLTQPGARINRTPSKGHPRGECRTCANDARRTRRARGRQ